MGQPKSEKDKKLADDEKLLRWWNAWHREQRDAVLAGPHGTVLDELFRMFKNLRHIQPSQLIGLISCVDWAPIDYDTRMVVLHELNGAVTRYREKRGLAPIDDGLPHEPDTPYRTIKQILFPSNEGAIRGAARREYPFAASRSNSS